MYRRCFRTPLSPPRLVDNCTHRLETLLEQALALRPNQREIVLHPLVVYTSLERRSHELMQEIHLFGEVQKNAYNLGGLGCKRLGTNFCRLLEDMRRDLKMPRLSFKYARETRKTTI